MPAFNLHKRENLMNTLMGPLIIKTEEIDHIMTSSGTYISWDHPKSPQCLTGHWPPPNGWHSRPAGSALGRSILRPKTAGKKATTSAFDTFFLMILLSSILLFLPFSSYFYFFCCYFSRPSPAGWTSIAPENSWQESRATAVHPRRWPGMDVTRQGSQYWPGWLGRQIGLRREYYWLIDRML